MDIFTAKTQSQKTTITMTTEVNVLLHLKSKKAMYHLYVQTSEMYKSACLRSSPMISTLDVVPSPVISSWAVATLAIKEAVGC